MRSTAPSKTFWTPCAARSMGQAFPLVTFCARWMPAVSPYCCCSPQLILVSPLSGIPGLSSLGGLTIALVAGQILLGRPAIWLPGFLLRRQLPTARLIWALSKLERAAAFIDRKTSTRAEWVFGFPGRHLALLICMACGLIMPFFRTRALFGDHLGQSSSAFWPARLSFVTGCWPRWGLSGFGFAVLLIAKLAAT